jgi:hypothetical protein
MGKQIVKLNETQLRNVVKESVKRILNESVSMNMENKQVIRLNESQLRQIVSESVKNLLNEWEHNDFDWDAINKRIEFYKEKYANMPHVTYQGVDGLCRLYSDGSIIMNGDIKDSEPMKIWCGIPDAYRCIDKENAKKCLEFAKTNLDLSCVSEFQKQNGFARVLNPKFFVEDISVYLPYNGWSKK